MRKLRVITLLVTAISAAACGSSHGTTTTPTPTSQLSGTITDETGAVLSSAHVAVTSGANLNFSVNADSAGHYVLPGLASGAITIQVTAPGRVTASRDVTITGNQTLDVRLAVANAFTTGRALDLITQAGYSGVTVSGGGFTSSTTNASGVFTLTSSASTVDPLQATFAGPSVLTKQTSLRVPGASPTVSLLPSSFDLPSFDQMFRVPRLLRWRTSPPLVVETRAGQFVDVNAASVTTVSDSMTDDEYNGMVADLTWALPQLSGGTFTAFAGVTRQLSDPGTSLPELTDGQILVIRVVGLTQSAGYWGYSRWHYLADGTVTGGIVTVDRDFDRGSSPFRRSLRTHELGHALGYTHVTGRPSFMNAAATFEPTSWDQDACRLAFARQPGNVSPDTDPVTASLNVLGLPGTWSPPIR